MMAVPGVEAGVHVIFGLLAVLSSVALLALLYARHKDQRAIRILAIATAIFVWLAWFSVINVYTVEYKADKSVIVKYPETAAAHEFGMETKEHIFYTGLILATLLPLLSFSDIEKNRKLLMWIAAALIIGGLVMDMIGGWISVAAKQGWSFEAGGKT